jgi:hypothetical protein
LDTTEVCRILERLDTRFSRRIAGDRLFIPDELHALERAAAGDPRLPPVIAAARAWMRAPSTVTGAQWRAAYADYCAAARPPGALPDPAVGIYAAG